MSTGTVLPPPAALDSRHALRTAAPALALGLLVLGLLFQDEIAAAVQTWMGNAAYNHCFLVIPIVGYLLWDRRAVLRGAVPRPFPAAALAALPVGAVWLFADRLGIVEGRQLMAMCMVQLLFLGVLGWPIYRALLGPLLYLFFLVPFGDFITPQLQVFTTRFVVYGLNLLGIPNFADAFTIEIPEGTFEVAQACAGLRFLIAAIAFGCLYSLLIYRSPRRRGVFILISIIVPVIANGFRALGIVTLGHLLGSAQAAATDHVLYGWLFFSIVLLILVALGLPFREDNLAYFPVRDPGPGPARHSSLLSAAALVGVAMLGPLAALGLDRASAAALPTAFTPLPSGTCTQTQFTEQPDPRVAGRLQVQHLSCEGRGVVVRVELFSPRAQPREILKEERRLRDFTSEVGVISPLRLNGLTWRLISSEDPERTVATLIWIDNGSSAGGLRMRLRQAWANLSGGNTAPIVMAVTPDPDPGVTQRARANILAYLRAQPELAATLARLSAAATRSPAAKTE